MVVGAKTAIHEASKLGTAKSTWAAVNPLGAREVGHVTAPLGAEGGT
jgi:hypothetical protein